MTRTITRKPNQQATNNFTMYPPGQQLFIILSSTGYGKKLQLYDKEIVHGFKFFTFFLVLNETVEYLNPT